MKRSHTVPAALGLALVLSAAACSTTSEDTATPAATTQPAPAATATADLSTASTDLGQLVVDGSGMTVYYFTADTPGSGESACTGDCLTAWPPVHPTGSAPVVDGVTGEVATITGADGEAQVTIDGRPVYTFAGDTAAGDTAGQGVDDAWFAVAPEGAEITSPAPSATASSGY